MGSVFSPIFVISFICLIISFLTFIRLVSSDVYLYEHRLLPVIVAVMIIHDFYMCMIQVIEPGTAKIISLFADSCANIIVCMMMFYFMLIKKPRNYNKAIGFGIAVMAVVNLLKFAYFLFEGAYYPIADIITEVVVIVGVLYTVLSSESNRTFEQNDKSATRMMYLAFILTQLGYILHIISENMAWIVGVVFAVNCTMYYYMARTNRIEDMAVVIGSAVFNVVNTPIIIVDTQFYTVDANEAASALFPAGKDVSFAFENGNYKNKFLLGQNMVARNENDKEFVAGDKWYLTSWSVVDGKSGPKGYIFQFIDVTSQHTQMVEAKEQTAEKSQFLAHMSHELRSPLHAIIGVSDILLGKHDISTKNRNLVQHIKKASDGLLDVVDSILDFSKLEAGKFTFTEKRYCIADLFEELSYNNIVNLQSKPVDFTLTVKTDYPKHVFGDQLRVREVFQNLLSNAVKFTDSGCINTEIEFEQVEDSYLISFTVEDTGAGMTPELVKSAFREYVSESGAMEGTGLGLSITKQLIELMGGFITVESDGFSGTKFCGEFYQKVCDSDMLAGQMYNRKNVMNRDNALALSGSRTEWIYPGAKILIADDMKINQEILTQILAPWRCSIVCVSDGVAAVAAAKEQNFDLILLDQMMAPMGGPEAADSIRKFSDVPIVLVTANTEDNVQSLIHEHGINDFVGKPIHVPNIVRIMDQYMPVECREKNLEETAVASPRRNNIQNLAVYKKTLETFVKEMQPLLLHLSSYSRNDRDMFKIKVHGIKGVSRQIGRETFADQAEIMEMAAKSEHWQYVDKHLDEFLTALCDVVEDVVLELTEMAPEDNTFFDEEVIVNKKDEPLDGSRSNEVFEALLKAFDEFDISAIEAGITILDNMTLDKEQTKIYSKIIDAYDELEYEEGSAILSEYLNSGH